MRVQEYAADLALLLAMLAALATGALTYLSGAGWETTIVRGSLAMLGVGFTGWLLVKALSPAWFIQPRQAPKQAITQDAGGDSDSRPNTRQDARP